jgi:two-component system, OmpR family, sensor kinase
MAFRSIRWRLQVWHGLILVLILGAFGITAYELQRLTQLRQIDDELQRRLNAVTSAMRAGRPHGPPPSELDREAAEPPGRDRAAIRRPIHFAPHVENLFSETESNAFYFVIWFRDGAELQHSSSAPAVLPRPERPARELARPIRMRGSFRETFHYTPPGECVLVGRSALRELKAIHRSAWWLGGAGGAVLLLGLAGGSWLAARAIRPIEDISATATRISAGNLSERITVPDAENELGRLAGILNSTFTRLEAAFAQQRQFTSDAAHELRTPVTVMLTQTQSALARERSNSEYREALLACERAARRMRSLIEPLLELARLEAGQAPIKRERCDLARIARECIELVQPLAAERQIIIHDELPELSCVADAERLGQIITNLLSNAIHYNKPGGKVHLTGKVENGEISLSVSDSGHGISSEDLPRIFDRFYRGDKSRAHANGRMGLGLAISKAIAEAHGGTITVLSEPGTGSTFKVNLPSVQAQPF